MNQELNKEVILSYLTEDAPFLTVLDTVDSTNTEAKRLLAQGFTSDRVILADCQTQGRGRLGKSFYSPKGSGLYMSLMMEHSLSVEELSLVTPFAAVAAYDAIVAVCGVEPEIKWVNDLYLHGKKICGILTELVENTLIIGVGINCTTVFDGELSAIAGSLNAEGIRCRLAAELVGRLRNLKQAMQEKTFLITYRQRSMLIGKTVTIVGEDGCYTVTGIGDWGELQLRSMNGNIRELRCGEVSVALIK